MSGRLTKEQLMGIKARVSLEKLVKTLTNGAPRQIVKTRTGAKAQCFFHNDENPSMTLDEERGTWRCWVCDEGGDAFSLVQRVKNTTFPGAIAFLSREFPSVREFIGEYDAEYETPEYDENTLKQMLEWFQNFYSEQLRTNLSEYARHARQYVENRGITQEMITLTGLGFAPRNDVAYNLLAKQFGVEKTHLKDLAKKLGMLGKQGYSLFNGRITFPVYSGTKICGFMARALTEKARSKYVNTAESELFKKKEMLIGEQNADTKQIRETGLYLVEGVTDLMGFYAQGLRNALTIGTTVLTIEQMSRIASMAPGRILLMTDGDKAGVQGALKNANRLRATAEFEKIPLFIVPFDKTEDPFDVFYTGEQPVEDYVWEKNLSVQAFFARQPDEFLLGDDGSTRFLEQNTYNIVPLEQLRSRFPGVQERRKTHIKLQ